MRGHRFEFEEEEKLYVMDLLGKKIIQPSSSEWAAAPVICMKPISPSHTVFLLPQTQNGVLLSLSFIDVALPVSIRYI
jgi:hypothetical protein